MQPKAGWRLEVAMPWVASVAQQTLLWPSDATDVARMATCLGLISMIRAARDRTRSSDQLAS